MTHPDAYRTIEKEGCGDFRDRGSKFPSYARACSNEVELKAFIEAVKKEHPAARHVCFGAVMGVTNPEERSNDDGEPSGTAGLPILNQLLSYNLKNAAVIVVRYFGGTKLGKPGLINAYKESAASALSNAGIKEAYLTSTLKVRFPYELTGDVIHRIEQFDHAEIVEHIYEQDGSVVFTVPKSTVDKALHLFDYNDEIILLPADSE